MAFDDIPGNGRVKKILRIALGHRRVPNSLLFCGPEGVGKKKTAVVVAKALNCLRKTDDACDECPNCRAIDNRSFPDVQEIVPATEVIKIEQIRTMKQQAYLKPMIGRTRVFIITSADRLQDEGSNALLKVLEEPPLFSQIMLVTSNPSLILPTIKSRCQTMTFLPVGQDEIERALRAQGIDEERARILALLVHGNLEKALDLDWDEVQESREEAWTLFRSMIGAEGSTAFFKKFGFQRRADVKENLGLTLELFASFSRDLVLLKSGGDPRRLFNPDYEPRFRESAQALDFERALRFPGIIDGALAAMDRSLNAGLLVASLYSQIIG